MSANPCMTAIICVSIAIPETDRMLAGIKTAGKNAMLDRLPVSRGLKGS